MSDENPLSSKVGLDTTDFKTGVAALNREIRVIESGFRASAAALGDWSKDATGLEQRINSLNQVIDVQRQKVEATRKEYQRIKAEKGENSRAAQDLEIRLNRETETLNKMSRELSDTEKNLNDLQSESKQAASAVDDLGDKSKTSANGLKTLGTMAKGLGTTLSVTLGVLTAMVAIVATLAGALIGLGAATVGPASDLAETISKVGVVFDDQSERVLAFGENSATALGMSKNEALGAVGVFGNLFRAMEMTTETSADMSLELVNLAADLASFNNMNPTEVLDKLRAGVSGESEPLKELGVNINAAMVEAKAFELGLVTMTQSTLDLQKAQISAEKAQTAYNDAIKKYGADSIQARDAALKMADAQQNVEAAAQGSATELTAAQKAQATYALIMEQTTLAQGDFARTASGAANQGRTLKAILEDMRAEIGAGFIPIMEGGQQALTGLLGGGFVGGLIDGFVSEMSGLTGILQPLFDELQNFDGDFGALTNVAVSVIQNLVAELAGGAPQMLQAGLDIIMTILQGVMQALPALLPVVLELVNSLVAFLVTSLPLLMDAGVQILLMLITGIVTALPSLVQAALQMMITLVQGLAQAMPTLIPMIATIIPQIILILLENLPLLIDAALQLILALATGLIAALPILIPAIPVIIQTIFDVLIASLPLILTAAGELIAVLVMGIIAALPGVLDAALQIIQTLYNALNPRALLSTLLEIGKGIVDGIWKGIQGQKDAFMSQIKGFFAGLVDTVKASLGIKSPSQLFADQVGKQIPAGIGKGITAALPGLERDMNQAMQGLTRSVDIQANLRGQAGGGQAAGGASINVGDIIINIPAGVTEPVAVGQAAQNGVLAALRARGG